MLSDCKIRIHLCLSDSKPYAVSHKKRVPKETVPKLT